MHQTSSSWGMDWTTPRTFGTCHISQAWSSFLHMPSVVPPPAPTGDWRRRSKNFAFWILLILVPVFFLQMSNGRGDAVREIKYSEYSHQLDNLNISRITTEAGQVGRGEFKDKVLIDGKPVKLFLVRFPISNSDRELERLQAAGVLVSARSERMSIGNLLLNVLPWVLVIAVWFFLMRQM